MGAGKKDPAGFSLVAHDEMEGKSEEGRALFKELCDDARKKGKTKELNEIHVGRVLDGQRRVTRDLLQKVMDITEVPNEQRAALWERYFGGAPDSIAQVVRRRVILAGSIRDYGKKVDLSHPSICWILENRATTAESLFKILTHGEAPAFPWKGQELMQKWRHEHEAYHMRKFDSNLLAARIETLFHMRPTASRIEWVERGNMPESLKGMSKNKIRILLSALRHGEPTSWESVDRVLFGMDCTLQERVEVAHAWLMAKKNPPPPRTKRETSESTNTDDEPKRHGGPKLADQPIPQKLIPYPTELADQPEFDIIRKLLDELRSADTDGGTLVADVSAVLEEVEAVQVTPKPAAPEPTTPPKERLRRERKPREKRAATTAKKQKISVDEVEAEEELSNVIDDETVEETVDEEVSDEVEETTEEVADDFAEVTEEETAPEEYPLEDAETMLFGPQKEAVIRDEDDEEILPDFARYTSVWQLGEFLENFSGRETLGYATTEEAATIIAAEIAKRAPFSINDTVNAMKVLAYCFGRFPDSEATAQLTDAITRSVGVDGGVPGKKIMALLVVERRFSMFLTYYRDQHPDSAVTKLFAELTDLSVVEPHPEFDRFAQTDHDKSYDEKINPKPKPKIDEKKKAKLGRFEETKRLSDALEAESPWEDD